MRAAFDDAMNELMHAGRAGFDGLAVTEHSQSSYDMSPNPNLYAAALAHATEQEGLETAIYPVGRSWARPGSRCVWRRSRRSWTTERWLASRK